MDLIKTIDSYIHTGVPIFSDYIFNCNKKSIFSSNWNYRKLLHIKGSSGADVGYQVLLKVGESSTASNYDFHLDGNSKKFPNNKNQSGDLRFTNSSETVPLNFWVEKVEGTVPNRTAYVWVKIEDNLDNDVDIYCYYGNNKADNVSNGDNTFSLFDDFEGTVIDASKWTVETRKYGSWGGAGRAELDGNSSLHLVGNMYFSTGSGNVISIMKVTNGFSVQIKRKYTNYHYVHFSFGSGGFGPLSPHSALGWAYPVLDNGYSFGQTNTSVSFITEVPENHLISSNFWGNFNVFETVNFVYTKDGDIKWIHNGIEKLSTTSTKYLTNLKRLMISQGSDDYGHAPHQYVDYVLVRKYVSPEPHFIS